MKSKSLRSLRKRKTAFLKTQTLQDLGELLKIPAFKLRLIALKPEYQLFSMRKTDGSKRWIEDPAPRLKYVQRELNKYLQACYYHEASDAAYGFMLSTPNDPDPRNILTNAQKHLGRDWLFNADIENFFHQVSFSAVYQLFLSEPFNFEEELAQVLTELCTHKERLPMGAPTSPVLSNYACRKLDEQLLSLGEWADWNITRFVDDMSFSSENSMEKKDLAKIYQVVGENGFSLNPDKVKLYGPEEPKLVTGLLLGEQGVELPPGFVQELFQEIDKLGHVIEAQHRFGRNSEWVEEYEQRVEGMITFASFVLGPNDPLILKADRHMESARDPEDQYDAVSWMSFGYF